ncbi:serine hydrolase [Streptomyces sp. DSM 44917]|uniref:Serine hydrolase n=2 Tax=Streptomyces boetiae TaxID=3075541 RepID=A0ABU2LA06_9ACTN|nr:serine hydrolase [Streptomyces sp. DSM 44917]MDT0308167.1 serine hydrolase [Streptomyces sp. DSM 44917]
MSAVGGERLGRPGTQVDDGDGVPGLPGDLTARSWIVADAESGDVLAAHNAHWPLPPASTMKMLFADTLLPRFDRDEEYRARAQDFADLGPGSSAVGIREDRTYTVEDLWHGVFLASGNDAVAALSAMNGGLEQTVEDMNDRAEELQARDTLVRSPDGYDARGQTSSAYDLTLIARHGLQNPDFREYASTARTEFPGGGDGEDTEEGEEAEEAEEGEDGGDGEDGGYEIQNTNRLLVGAPGLDTYPGIAGVKNGYTSQAGYTFTGVAEREDRVLLVTVMHPEDGDSLAVYREAAALLDWGFEAAEEAEPVGVLVPPLSEATTEPTPGEGEGEATETGAPERRGAAADGNGRGEETSRDSALAGASGTAGDDGRSPALTVLAATAVGLILLTAAGWAFHRRHPLPLPGGTGRSADSPGPPGRRDGDPPPPPGPRWRPGRRPRGAPKE